MEISRRHMLDFLGLNDLRGKYFLDIGCGSGLHSLAALRSGAAKIVSFDFDPDSVATTRRLHEYAGRPSIWEVLEGSILDERFIQSIPPADIVYSWGVLHHTGHMWQAMDQTVRLMHESSLLYLALYDYDIQVRPSAEFWLHVKRRYNRAGWAGRRLIEAGYLAGSGVVGLIKRPRAYIRSLRRRDPVRGMSFYADLVDWLGGWPMEFARRRDVREWSGKRGLEIKAMKTGEANTEYLFSRCGNADGASARVSVGGPLTDGNPQ